MPPKSMVCEKMKQARKSQNNLILDDKEKNIKNKIGKLNLNNKMEGNSDYFASLGFRRSKTMPTTPGDNDCMIHAINDQLKKFKGWRSLLTCENPLELRKIVVAHLPIMITTNKITWNYTKTASEGEENSDPFKWMTNMLTPSQTSGKYPFCDEVFIRCAANVFHVDIIIVHDKQSDKDGWNKIYHTIEACVENISSVEKIYLEYTGEGKNGRDWQGAHYSSIELTNDSLIQKHLLGEDVLPPPLLSHEKPSLIKKVNTKTCKRKRQIIKEDQYLLNEEPLDINIIEDDKNNTNHVTKKKKFASCKNKNINLKDEDISNKKEEYVDQQRSEQRCHLCCLPLVKQNLELLERKMSNYFTKNTIPIDLDIEMCTCQTNVVHKMCISQFSCVENNTTTSTDKDNNVYNQSKISLNKIADDVIKYQEMIDYFSDQNKELRLNQRRKLCDKMAARLIKNTKQLETIDCLDDVLYKKKASLLHQFAAMIKVNFQVSLDIKETSHLNALHDG